MKVKIIPKEVCCRLMNKDELIKEIINIWPEMLSFCGKEANIKGHWRTGCSHQGDKIEHSYNIDLDSGKFLWPEEMFDTKMRFKT